jgi:hypothetical protein
MPCKRSVVPTASLAGRAGATSCGEARARFRPQRLRGTEIVGVVKDLGKGERLLALKEAKNHYQFWEMP